MVDFTFSKKQLSSIKQNIITRNYSNFTKIAQLKKQSTNQFILENIPSLILNHDKCLSRVWNNGFGKQCSRCQKTDKYCQLHYNEIENHGYLKHGNIMEPPPKTFKKMSI